MGKGTPSMGKRSKGKTHIRCPRCGRHSYNVKKHRCSYCGWPSPRWRSYSWSKRSR
ncbi:MAG: 50S ribosomal protein L37e [Thermoplasmata archaeon]|nr:MAG: 50S ribosomal protein L37e [Thermoplasmata archaeon]HDJ27120.1 50S ribosomal protein L37e [Aciduliprofundum sp.]